MRDSQNRYRDAWGLWCAMLWALPLHAQVPLQWTAESSKAKAAEFVAYRGETLDVQPTFTVYGSNVSPISAQLYWQTNGMGDVWWRTNVLRFAPDMDVGASSYALFVRASFSNGVSYRANAVLRMLASPGYTPNALPLPAQSIDFATVTMTNAPWLLPDALDGYYTRTETDAALHAKASTQQVSQAISSAVAPLATTQSMDAAIAPLATKLQVAAISNDVASLSTQRVTRVYNPTNALEWYEIRGDEKWTYTVDTIEAVAFSSDFGHSYYGVDARVAGKTLAHPVEFGNIDEFNTYGEIGYYNSMYSWWYGSGTGYWGATNPEHPGTLYPTNPYNPEEVNAVGTITFTTLPITNITVVTLASLSDLSTHNSDASSHPSIITKLYALPTQPQLSLTNNFSTNANSRLVISASNGVLRVQEVIP